MAEARNAEAQFGVAILCNNSLGVQRDYLQGDMWYRKSADQGYSGAQYDLGVMYELGQGVRQDYVLAYMWPDLAASISRPDDFMVEKRDEVAAKMTPDQIAEAQRLAREWRPK